MAERQPDAGWRALHVYRFGEQDRFLLDGLAPVLNGLRDSGALHGFFFLRYWQGGHHVRVRLRLSESDADAVLTEVAAKLAAHLAESPAVEEFDGAEFDRDAQPTMAALENVPTEQLQAPDTIREQPYEPEYTKYGGPAGVAIAERFFEASSRIVLANLDAVAGKASKRLGAGFSMMLRGLLGAGLDAARMAEFFGHYSLVWSGYTFEGFLDAWPDLLRERRAGLRAHAEQLLELRAQLGADPYAAAVADAVGAVRADEQLILPEVTMLGAAAEPARRARALLVSYLHTHNNRFGLIPEHEAFLGYLGHHVLADCAGIEPDPELLRIVRAQRSQRLGVS